MVDDAESLKRFTDSLEHFKDWSNYLLVTTVAALGWVATKEDAVFRPRPRSICIWLFALSVVFAIFTLAMIPLVAEQGHGYRSIYDVPITFWLMRWSGLEAMHLICVCFPQHVLFILGIIVYAVGTTGRRPGEPVGEAPQPMTGT